MFISPSIIREGRIDPWCIQHFLFRRTCHACWQSLSISFCNFSIISCFFSLSMIALSQRQLCLSIVAFLSTSRLAPIEQTRLVFMCIELAAVQLQPREKGEAEGTHIFERDAPWTLGLAHRSTERDIGPLCAQACKAAFTSPALTERSRRGSGSSGSFGAV